MTNEQNYDLPIGEGKKVRRFNRILNTKKEILITHGKKGKEAGKKLQEKGHQFQGGGTTRFEE